MRAGRHTGCQLEVGSRAVEASFFLANTGTSVPGPHSPHSQSPVLGALEALNGAVTFERHGGGVGRVVVDEPEGHGPTPSRSESL